MIFSINGDNRRLATLQGCQLSRIIRETPDFEPFLPVSRLESEISRIIAEARHFLWIRLSQNEISNILPYLSYFTANIEPFPHKFRYAVEI